MMMAAKITCSATDNDFKSTTVPCKPNGGQRKDGDENFNVRKLQRLKPESRTLPCMVYHLFPLCVLACAPRANRPPLVSYSNRDIVGMYCEDEQHELPKVRLVKQCFTSRLRSLLRVLKEALRYGCDPQI